MLAGCALRATDLRGRKRDVVFRRTTARWARAGR